MRETDGHLVFMQQAIALGQHGLRKNHGGPFGAVVVKDGEVIGNGWNQVLRLNDPSAHAEIMAIRDACQTLGSFQLDGCTIYSSCEPCPMCLGAIYWARPKRLFFACSKEDAARAEFDDDFIYREMTLSHADRSIPSVQIGREEALHLFREWSKKEDKRLY